MRHVEKALLKYEVQHPDLGLFINIENVEDVKGISPVVKFTIQSDPISDVGINGCQATDILEYVMYLFESLNEVIPCEENEITMNHIFHALQAQKCRTKDRENRKVEGLQIK